MVFEEVCVEEEGGGADADLCGGVLRVRGFRSNTLAGLKGGLR